MSDLFGLGKRFQGKAVQHYGTDDRVRDDVDKRL